jgi:cysteinyl-tRNA synthetase
MQLKDYTEKFAKAFFEDIQSLNIEPAEVYPRATDHINEMVAIIKVLLKKKLAYKTADGIYFDISKFKSYGKLANINIKELRAGGSGRMRADEYEKEQIQDFALWKFYTKDDGDVFWEDDIGKGRPGWHIECSAMSMKHLTPAFENGFKPGKFITLDIHTGGVDHIFPHHPNEIAQSEGATGKTFAKYWMHNEFLLVEGKKMAKRFKNFYTLRDVTAKGYDPIAVRYVLISGHYRQQLNFKFAELDAAKKTLDRLRDFASRLSELKNGVDNPKAKNIIETAKKHFEAAMDDDLNMPQALAAVFRLENEANKLMAHKEIGKTNAKAVLLTLKKFDSVIGLKLADLKNEKLSKEIEGLIKKRESARKKKDFKTSDSIREKLKAKGIILEDIDGKTRWRKA